MDIKKLYMRALAILIFLLLNSFLSVSSQKLSQNRYWIPFTDKEGNGYSISAPEEFLTERAIQRRLSQNIPIKSEDLPVSQVYVDSLRNLGVTILGTSKWFNAAIVESSDSVQIRSLGSLSFVKSFNYQSPLRLSTSSITDKYYNNEILAQLPNQSHYGFADKQISILNGKPLHHLGYKGRNIIIAILDAGFYQADSIPAFDSLWLNNRIITWHDFGKPPYPDFFRGDSHGMSVLSTMGANIPGEFVGTSPDASFILLRSEVIEYENLIEEAWWLLAAEFADSCGADIINSSLGYSIFDDSTQNYSFDNMDGKTALSTLAAEKAFSKGMIVVVSAGNEGNKPWQKITAPSDGKNILSVGAIDTFLNHAAFSSYGPSADNRIKPDIMAVGLRTVLTSSEGFTSSGNGTSFSSPQIAGMVACLWQALPGKTNLELIDAIRRSSSQYFSPDNINGYGVPDFFNAFNRLSSLPEEKNDLLVIPNPTTGIFEIQLINPEEPVIKVYIYNAMGRNVAVINNPEIRSGYVRVYELEGFEQGIYFINVKTAYKNYMTKIIKL